MMGYSGHYPYPTSIEGVITYWDRSETCKKITQRVEVTEMTVTTVEEK